MCGCFLGCGVVVWGVYFVRGLFMGSDLVKTDVESLSFGSQLKAVKEDVFLAPRSSVSDGARFAGKFVSIFDSAWATRVRDNTAAELTAPLCFGPGFLGILPIALLGDSGSPMVSFLAFLGTAVVTAVPLGLWHRTRFSRNAVVVSKMVIVTASLVEVWLEDVYGESFSDEDVSQMAEFIIVNEVPSEIFVAESGRSYQLKSSESEPGAAEQAYYLVEQREAVVVGERAAESVLELPEVVSDPEVALPESVDALLVSLLGRLSRLSRLKTVGSDVEVSHQVSRMQQDAQQALFTYQKLMKLGDPDGVVEAGKALSEVLGLLNDEARMLVTAKSSMLANDFRVQREYLRSRTSADALVLTPGVSAVDVSKKDVIE